MNETSLAAVGVDVVPVMGVVCAYCKAVMRVGAAPVSHGICLPCLEEQRALIRAKTQVRANERAISPRVLAWKVRGGSGGPSDIGPLPRALPGLTASETSPLLAGGIPRAVAAGRPDRDEPARPTRFLIESPARLRTFVRDNVALIVQLLLVFGIGAWTLLGTMR